MNVIATSSHKETPTTEILLLMHLYQPWNQQNLIE